MAPNDGPSKTSKKTGSPVSRSPGFLIRCISSQLKITANFSLLIKHNRISNYKVEPWISHFKVMIKMKIKTFYSITLKPVGADGTDGSFEELPPGMPFQI